MPSQMQDEMMDSSTYGNAPVEAPEAKATESVDEANAGSAAILISKDKLPSGTKPGDTCTFKVSKDVGEDYILEYVKDEETAEETNETPEATTDRELTALDSQGQ